MTFKCVPALVLAFVSSGARAEPLRLELTPRPAATFTDAVGVNMHLWDAGTVYARKFDAIKERLLELGVRHVRDAGAGGYPGYAARVADLAANGVRFNVIIDPRPPTSGIDKGLAFLAATGDAIESVEGPNEFDNSGQKDWVQQLTKFQSHLFERIKEQSRRVDVVAPSFVHGAQSFTAFGAQQGSATIANLHHYFAGRHPGTPGWGEGGYGSIPWALKNTNEAAHGLPVYVTEAGYPNALQNKTSGNKPVPETIAGRYIPRLVLNFMAAGAQRVYLYELADGFGDKEKDVEASFGLVRNDEALTPKPAFAAMKFLLTLLRDTTGTIDASPLTLDIAGTTGNSLRSMLFRKQDRTSYLLLWLEEPAWDPDARRELPVGSRQILVRSPDRQFSGRKLHTIDDAGKSSTVNLQPADEITVSDRVTVLELTP